MEYGSMVHALEEIHRLLKPSGVLIDIHPVSEPSLIEIHQDGKIDLVGHLSVRQWCIDFEQADSALAEIVQRGLYLIEHNDMFDTLTYYDSAAEMSTAFREEIEKYARDDEAVDETVLHVEALATRAEELMLSAGSEAELARRERNHISRLKPSKNQIG
jgi:hypothetical protein